MPTDDESISILIVEDDHITALNLEATVKRQGIDVVGMAESGIVALELAERMKPDLAVLDIKLTGEMNGIELAIQLREKFAIPVVFLTGYSEDAIFAEAREARPVGYLRKPFGDGEVAASLFAAAERGKSQRELVDCEINIRTVAASIENAVVASDIDGRVTLMNQRAESLTGWTEADAIGHRLREVVSLRENGENSTTRHNNGFHEATLLNRSGEETEIRERTVPIRNSGGDALGLLTVIYTGDETEPAAGIEATPANLVSEKGEPPARGRALETAARMSKSASFRELLGFKASGGTPPTPEKSEFENEEAPSSEAPKVDDIGDPVITIDEDGKIAYGNAEALAWFGGATPLIGRDFWEAFGPEDRLRYRLDFQKSADSGRRHIFEFHDTERDTWHEVRTYRSGNGTMALFRDISDRKQQQSEQIRQQRLEGLSLLARGFAHDFNNHLTTLTGNLSFAKERHEDDSELQNSLAEAQSAASRAQSLVQQLMTFARGGKAVRDFVTPPQIIRDVLAERREAHPMIRYQFQCGDPKMTAYLDASQVHRLVENLIANAEEAMAEGGVLITRCGIIDSDEVRQLRGELGNAEQKHLLIEVIDTGHGMDPITLERAFDPYFTTRRSDNATGIGLTVCESIAKAHDGFVALQSKEDRGTIATFCMPLTAPFKVSERPGLNLKSEGESKAIPKKVGPGKILILEDEQSISRLMRVTLTRAGHEVVETADGRDTILKYREAMASSRRFDLLVSDLTIEGGVGGVETIRALRRIDPDVVAIVSSGYSDAAAMAEPEQFGFCDVLPKPYAPRELVEIVNRALAKIRPASGNQDSAESSI